MTLDTCAHGHIWSDTDLVQPHNIGFNFHPRIFKLFIYIFKNQFLITKICKLTQNKRKRYNVSYIVITQIQQASQYFYPPSAYFSIAFAFGANVLELSHKTYVI